jgi:hypothetical protein
MARNARNPTAVGLDARELPTPTGREVARG